MTTPAPVQAIQRPQEGQGSTNGREVSLQGKTQISLKDDPESKTRLNEALLMAFDALKTYGKEPEQLDSVKKLMHFALADYPWKKIQDALAFYFRHNTEFPAPADLVQIIERGNKPPFDRAVYTDVHIGMDVNKDGYSLYDGVWDETDRPSVVCGDGGRCNGGHPREVCKGHAGCLEVDSFGFDDGWIGSGCLSP
jgi:hypothetical protein